MHKGVDPELPQVVARRARIIDAAEIGPRFEAVLDATEGEGERAAAVREAEAQFRQSLEHAAEDHRGDRLRSFGGHSDQPREPVLLHPLLAHHVPGVHENGAAQLRGPCEDWKQLGSVEVPAADVRADLHAREAQVADAAGQFLDGEIGRLQGQRAQAQELAPIPGARIGELIVEEAGDVERLPGLRDPVTEHDRHGGEHLHADLGLVALGDAHGGVPHVGRDVAKERPVVADHARGARVLALEADESAVAEPLAPARDLGGEKVGMDVNASHASDRTSCTSCSPGFPSSARRPAEAA